MVSLQKHNQGLNRLIRGEIAAMETYRQAIDQLPDEPEVSELHDLLFDHRMAAEMLQRHVQESGGIPADSSGPWGAWARTVEWTAQLFGPTTTLRALKQGERVGVRSYERFLADGEADRDCQSLIRSQLLPQARLHAPLLDRLISVQS